MRQKIVWLGNSAKKELHRIVTGEDHPKQCQLDEILPEHQVKFRTAKEAREAKYDPSAFCTVRFKSRR